MLPFWSFQSTQRQWIHPEKGLQRYIFFTGLFSGFILAAIIAIVFVSFYHSAPEHHKITGSMMDGNYVPSLGEHGMVVGYWEGMYPTPQEAGPAFRIS